MSSAKRYSTGAMAFHWLIAGLVIWNWLLAKSAESAASREEAIAIFADHKAIGITILVLSVLRLLWRFTHRPPPLPVDYPTWEKGLAHLTHILFYVLLIGLPLGGWLANSLAGREVDMFGLFVIPAIPVAVNEGAAETVFGLHKLGAFMMLILFALHVLGALKHTILEKDGNLFRMLPFGRVGKQ